MSTGTGSLREELPSLPWQPDGLSPAPSPGAHSNDGGLQALDTSSRANPWYSDPIRDRRPATGVPVRSPAELSLDDIQIEDFGFDEVEIEPSQRRQEALEEITKLRDNVVSYEIPPFLQEFDKAKKSEALVIGTVSVEELEEHEEQLELQRLREAEEEALRHAEKQAELAKIELEARSRLQSIWQKHSQDAAARELMRVDATNRRKNTMQRAFVKAEEQLRIALERRKAEVQTYYGDLTSSEALDAKLRGRHFRLDWASAPQPIEIRCHAIHGIRDKLPHGHYVLRVTIMHQINGFPLEWNRLGSAGTSATSEHYWNLATPPARFDGGFGLDFDHSLYTATPSQRDMKPSMCLIFQLFRIKNSTKPKSTEVGWSAFPLSDPKFAPIRGRFQVPMLRGKKDPVVDKYSEVEHIIASDIDNWLGNLYFEARHLERYIDGHREYDVELEFTTTLLEMAPEDPSGKGWQQNQEDELEDKQKKQRRFSAIHTEWLNEPAGDARNPFKTNKVAEDNEKKALLDKEEDVESKGVTDPLDQFAPIESKENDKSQRYKVASDVSFCFGGTAKGQAEALDEDEAMREARQRNEKYRRHKSSWREHINQYKYNLPEPIGHEQKRKSSNKIQYVWRSLIKDLGLHHYPYITKDWNGWHRYHGSLEFWLTVILMIIIFFMRGYIHYIGQWIVLKIENIVVSKFDPKLGYIELEYLQASVKATIEFLLVLIGPFACQIVFLLMTAVAAFSQWWLDTFPPNGCRFIAAWGLISMFDSAIILVMDVLRGNTTKGDAFKLYEKFKEEEGSGVTGVFLTMVCYGILICYQAIVLFFYLLRIHMNGHMQDVYARLHGGEYNFFVPFDSEVSWREVRYACRRAREWRGEGGQVRKVQVVDFVHRDRYDADFEERTTCCTIFTTNLSTGSRVVYRQFVRSPEGCILEKFGKEIMDTDMNMASGQRHRHPASGIYGVLLDAIAGPGSQQRHVESQAVGPSSLEEVVANHHQKKQV